MADYTQLMNLERKQKPTPFPAHTQQAPSPQTSQSIDQSIERSTHRLSNQSTIQSSTNTGNRIMEKPRGFYITERLNQRIDEAVRYYQEKHNIKKVDRSIVLTAMLDNEAYWTEESLDLMLDRILSQLTSRLTNR